MPSRKGSPNKRAFSALRIIKADYPHYDPLRSMIECANDPDADLSLKLAAHKEVAQYMYPKRKAVELTGEDGGPVKHSVKVTFK